MKLLALHLPQFYETEENNIWWGKGFTEWTNVKNSKPLFEWHEQPVLPINNNYYDLSKKQDINNQAMLAKKYGIYGFVYFHYWFEGTLMLEKPCEILLKSNDIKINYCFCWANHSWTRSWDGKEHEFLRKQTYGGKEDWKNHFNYLLKFFLDDRYIKINNKPMLFVYAMCNIPNCNEMVKYFDGELKKYGFDGIYIVEYISSKNKEVACKLTAAVYEDEPVFSARFQINAYEKLKRLINKKLNRVDILDYDHIWNLILNKNRTYRGKQIIQGAYPAWDNTPRRGNKGATIFKGSSPEKFAKYLKMLVFNTPNRQDASKDFIVINAWNEWGEGAVLEPSENYGFKYLEAVRDVMRSLNNEQK